MIDNNEIKNIYHQGFIDALTHVREQSILMQYKKLPKDDEFVVVKVDLSTIEEANMFRNQIKDILHTDNILIVDKSVDIDIEIEDSNQVEVKKKKDILMENIV